MNAPARTRTRFARARWAAAVLLPLTLIVAAVLWRTMSDNGAPGSAPGAGDSHAGHGSTLASSDSIYASDGSLVITNEMLTTLGVGTVEVELAPMQKTIRTTGNVVYDETRLTTVAPRYAGFVERLFVNFTGQAVRRGQPLLEVYSPELVAAQEELLSALRLAQQLKTAGAADAVLDRTAVLVEAARRRLVLWDVSAAQIQEIERSEQVQRTITLHAPFGGFVIEKMVQAGQAIAMGEPLYRLADLSTVWVEADIYEQDLRMVKEGDQVQVQIDAYPGESFTGRASYIYPEVRPETRTGRLRVALPNTGGRIKPGMYATVLIEAPLVERAVFVPRDAVMHSGTHAMVFVQEAEGLFRIREVTTGSDLGGRTQILAGLIGGERVVNRANFLLDSESRLKDALGSHAMDH